MNHHFPNYRLTSIYICHYSIRLGGSFVNRETVKSPYLMATFKKWRVTLKRALYPALALFMILFTPSLASAKDFLAVPKECNIVYTMIEIKGSTIDRVAKLRVARERQGSVTRVVFSDDWTKTMYFQNKVGGYWVMQKKANSHTAMPTKTS